MVMIHQIENLNKEIQIIQFKHMENLELTSTVAEREKKNTGRDQQQI